MQISSETRAAIADAFSGFRDEDDIKASIRRAIKDGEIPFGDPSNGPRSPRLFGRVRRDAPAVAAFALVFAEGVVTVASVASVVMYAGMAITVVGAVTGNQAMMKVGGIMSMAGGIVGFAAGAIGGASAAAGEGMVAGETGALDMGVGGSGVLDSGAASGATTGLETAATQGIEAGANAASAVNPNGSFGVPEVTATPNPIGNQPSGFNVDPVNTSSPLNISQNPANAQSMNGSWTPGQPSEIASISAPPAGSGTGPGFWDFLNKLSPDEKSKLTTALIQGGGQLVSGIASGWSEEQKLALQQEMYNTQQSNARAQPSFGVPKPAATGGLLGSSRAM